MATNPNFSDRLDEVDEITGEGPRPLFRELPPPAPFPIDALGAVLGKAARAVEGVIQCPMECAANSELAVASQAARGCANVVVPIGQGKLAPLSALPADRARLGRAQVERRQHGAAAGARDGA